MKLTPELLRLAYSQGYFPMPEPESGELAWFNPDPRAVIPLDGFHVSHSLRRVIRSQRFTVSLDAAFEWVMQGCADRDETWITPDFLRGYTSLHREGGAHSVEVWRGGALVGGVYGVSLKGAFFAESKFHREPDASKVALFHLVEHLRERDFQLLEVQFLTPHLARLGAIEISAEEYHKRLRSALRQEALF